MSDTPEVLSTIDDYLLSLADGIVRAQEQLARLAAAGPTGQQYHYYLPRLDFEMKLTVSVVEDESLNARYQRRELQPGSNQHLLFKSIRAGDGQSTSAELVSTIKGSFVAVPANDGLPATGITVTPVRRDAQTLTIRVDVRRASGEAVSGVEVEYNLDRDESAATNTSLGMAVTPVFRAGTTLTRGVVVTGADGRAEADVLIDPAQPVGSALVVVVDAAGKTRTLVHRVAP